MGGGRRVKWLCPVVIVSCGVTGDRPDPHHNSTTTGVHLLTGFKPQLFFNWKLSEKLGLQFDLYVALAQSRIKITAASVFLRGHGGFVASRLT
jgi:hypothetical protein